MNIVTSPLKKPREVASQVSQSANQSECTSHVCCGKLLELTKAQAFEHQRLQ